MSKRLGSMLMLLAAVIAIAFASRSWVSSIGDEPGGRFSPPDSRARKAAIGSTANLSEDLRLSFSPGDDFDPISSPGDSDWLANHREFGQSFAQFVRGRPNRPVAGQNRIYLQPLGDFSGSDPPDLERLREFAASFFSLPVLIEPHVPLDTLPIKRRRRGNDVEQLLSTDVLEWLRSKVPEDAFCLLAVTMKDLYPDEEWNFVFGQASLRDRVGVFSFARYTPDFDGRSDPQSTAASVLERSCKVLAHETGHMFGMKHCIHFHCLMNGSNHLAESDRKPLHLCPVCLRKLQSSNQFDVLTRYKELHAFANSVGWFDERDWLAGRMELLEGQSEER